MQKKIFCVGVITLLKLCVFAQNLILDYSFEQIKDISKEHKWYNPTLATPDFHTTVNGDHIYGTRDQKPKSGKAYIGISIDTKNREYVQTKLSSPLTKNTRYCVSVYVSLKEGYDMAANEIEFALTPNKISQRKQSILKVNKGGIARLKNGYFLTDKENWVQVCAVYHAGGGEKYLTIGSFSSYFTFLNIRTHDTIQAAIDSESRMGTFYFFDDISIEKVDTFNSCKCMEEEQAYTAREVVAISTSDSAVFAENEKIILENILFATDSAVLLPESFSHLNKLVNYLLRNNHIQIEIYGHTDNTGSEEYNKTLSENRAKAVVEYIENKGIDRKRINYFGMGSSFPITSNDSVEGRKKNRRVEVRLYKKP